MTDHQKFMMRAIELSRKNVESGAGGPFGAVIAKDGLIISEGWNQVTLGNDPTAHAEIVAIREACKKIASFNLEGASIYTSCEPCPMCLSAIYWARISKVYFANSKTDAANIQFDDDFIYQEIPKKHEHRKIEMVQLLRDEAIKVFNVWESKVDKIQY
jgi:tRNA(Arg) A34 adenosine deaminase TadA